MRKENDGSMTLIEHLAELRSRLLWSIAVFLFGFLFVFSFSDGLLHFFFNPVRVALEQNNLPTRLQFTSPLELLFAKIRVAMLGGILVSMPVILYHVWAFVAPGLYKNEKSAMLPFLLASPFMFLLGASFAQFFMNPLAMNFLIGLAVPSASSALAGQGLEIEYVGKVNENLNFAVQLIFAFGFCFQLPVALSLLGKVGLITSQALKTVRRYAIVAIMVLAAVVTPPDPVTQLILFSVIYSLYEISIWLVKYLEPKFDDQNNEKSE